MFCKQCGKPIDDGQELCEDCKAKIENTTSQESPKVEVETEQTSSNASTVQPAKKSKIAAGLLGIFLGSLGVHNFYLGYTGKAIAQLLITLLTCGFGAFISSIWGIIEGILILTGSINVDGNGNPLGD